MRNPADGQTKENIETRGGQLIFFSLLQRLGKWCDYVRREEESDVFQRIELSQRVHRL